MSSSYCGIDNLLLPVKSLTGTDAMAADGTFLSASVVFSFDGSQVQRLQTTNMHTAWCAEDTASKHGSAHALADQDDLSQAAAAFFLT